MCSPRKSTWIQTQILLTWLVIAVSLILFLFAPWHNVVKSTPILLVALAGFTLIIFCCSASEIALIDIETHITTEQENLILSPKKSNWIKRFLAKIFTYYFNKSVLDGDLTNAIIVLTNTSIVTTMTVVVGDQIKSGVNGSNMFVIIGTSIPIFLLGEMLPKQFARNRRESPRMRKFGRACLRIMCLTFLVPLLATGVVETFKK